MSDAREETALERTPDGRRLVVSRRMDRRPEAVWAAFRDTRRWPEWGPSVTDVDCEDRHVEAGTTGRVRTVGGLWLPFEVTTCADHRWTWDVARVPATGHRVSALGEDRALAAFEVPVLAAGYVPVCRRALRRLERVARRVETDRMESDGGESDRMESDGGESDRMESDGGESDGGESDRMESDGTG